MTLTAATTRPQLDAALAYARIGVAIIPIWPMRDGKCACARPDCKSPGKHPIETLVPHGAKGATCDTAAITTWFNAFPDANMAMPAGQNSVVVIDIDPRNGGNETWDDLTVGKEIPTTLHAQTGGGGEHFYFLFPGDKRLKGKLGPGVDIKSGNGYVLIEPSKTAGCYYWLDDCSPLEGMHPAPAPEWLLALMVATDAPMAPEGVPAPGSLVLGQAQMVELRAAVFYLNASDYHTWVRVGLALVCLGAAGRGLWLEWSSQYEGFSAAEAAKKWKTFAASEITYLSIFADAQAVGWVNPQSKAATNLAELTKRYSNLPPEPVLRDVPDAACVPFPVPVLNELAEWIAARAGLRAVDCTIQLAALSVAALACGRRYVSEFGDPVRLYLCMVAPTESSTRPILHATADFLARTNGRRLARFDRFTSTHKVYGALFSCPAMLHIYGGWGSLVEQAKRQPNCELPQVLAALAGLYDLIGDRSFSDPKLAGLAAGDHADIEPVLRHPALSILTNTSAAQLVHLFRDSEIGHSSQFLFARQQVVDFDEPQNIPAPAAALALFRQMRGIPTNRLDDMPVKEIFGGNAELFPVLVSVRFDRHPGEDYGRFQGDGRYGQTFAIAGRSTYRRIATILGALSNPIEPVASCAMQDWAREFVAECLAETQGIAKVHSSENGKASVYDRVLEEITYSKAVGMTSRDVRHQCHQFKALDKDKRSEVIERLLHDEAIVQISQSSGRGRPCNRYVAAQFVEKKAEE